MLMTAQEEAQAVIRPDGTFFAAGVPALVSAVVQKTWAVPFMAARRIFGAEAETALEPGARFLGKWAGKLGKSAFAVSRESGAHALEETLVATRIAENLTGIFGRDYYVNENKVVRRIHTCPFREEPGARILCHLGEAAGQELFEELVPGTKHKVHVTMARGHAFCEYSYEL
ncbi:MAG: hypothetical protein KF713_17325 [Turneriella sp.]|nr:hypothetical protein [Turneriella sp.]